jgi:hypothetical protein
MRVQAGQLRSASTNLDWTTGSVEYTTFGLISDTLNTGAAGRCDDNIIMKMSELGSVRGGSVLLARRPNFKFNVCCSEMRTMCDSQ